MPPPRPAAPQGPEQIRATIEEFLKDARQPALFEPGEELLALAAENFSLEMRGSRLTLQAWDRERNITRRVVAVQKAGGGRVELLVERFGRREGQLVLVDLARRAGADAGRRSARLVFRERFRLFLRRQFPEWKLAELSAEANLEYSLSPAFPRAFLRHGQHGWAAIACPPEGDAAAALSFGLIWLSYLRARERRVAVEGLALYVPAGRERAAALRLLCLDPARGALRDSSPIPSRTSSNAADPRDHGNLDTRLEPCAAARRLRISRRVWRAFSSLPGVERIPKHDGRASLRVRGIEFAELAGGELRFGLARTAARPANTTPPRSNAWWRSWTARDRPKPPTASIRSTASRPKRGWNPRRAREIETLDASLLREPVYGQTPVLAGGERGIIDLLAVDRAGRLAVIELKASADLHLPLQALDYWIHVKWHLDRGEFSPAGYFPGIELRPEPPRLLLVSPSLEFHPATEILLSYFAPAIDVERIGLAVEWRKGLQVMFRLRGAERPE